MYGLVVIFLKVITHCYTSKELHNALLSQLIVPLNNCKKNFVILQSIGIIAIKSSETRAVIYTCRYSSGQFNP